MDSAVIVAIVGTVFTFLGGVIGTVITVISQRSKLKSESEKLRSDSVLILEEVNKRAFDRFNVELELRDTRIDRLATEIKTLEEKRIMCSERIDILETQLTQERTKLIKSDRKIASLELELTLARETQELLTRDLQEHKEILQIVKDENERLKQLVAKNIGTGNLKV